MQMLIFNEFGLKMPIRSPKMEVLGITSRKRGAALSQSRKGTSLRRNTSYDTEIVKIGPTVFCAAHPFTQPIKSYALPYTALNVPLPVVSSAPYLIHGTLGPGDSASQTASCSVQPFFHSLSRNVPILYNVPPLAHFHGDVDLHLIHGSLGPREPSTQTAS